MAVAQKTDLWHAQTNQIIFWDCLDKKHFRPPDRSLLSSKTDSVWNNKGGGGSRIFN